MDQAVKEKWVAALNSGDYPQARATLRRLTDSELYGRAGYCCLGVLCELAVNEGVIPAPKEVDTVFPDERRLMYDGETGALPIAVQEWAGIKGALPNVEMPDGTRSLVALNDSVSGQWTFPEIAAVIEEYL